MPGTKKLVIVESPTKAKTIGAYLGEDYEVIASVGHIRDLAEPSELPAELKKGPFGKFAVDVENDFNPYYVVAENKKKTVTDLKRALKTADEVWLATDEDREGEAIAWHLLEVLKPKVPVRRMVFHEITQEAIEFAKNNTRDIDVALVDAQETRRILDRLYGYDLSPVLWRKVAPKLSAGRVQSAATRLVVDRERERLAFVSASYWDLTGIFGTALSGPDTGETFSARLARVDGHSVATGRDYDDLGQLTEKARKAGVVSLTEADAQSLVTALRASGVPIRVTSLETKPHTRRPAAPFTTSTLQQEASRKLRFTSRQTMSAAQTLYERGFITYMRTDSPSLSGQAINAARTQAAALYGAETVPSSPRIYKGKTKGAQEAHEAIRPAGDSFRTPQQAAAELTGSELKLYELIWKRTVASQMADAKGSTATVTLSAGPTGDDRVAEFTASGTVITFRGFLLAYEEGVDEKRHTAAAGSDEKLPNLTEGQNLALADIEAKGHETLPRPRYTEASLTKKLEELGIGRPSTYTAIISTIMDRGYVSKRGEALVPSWIAFSVVRLLEEHFTELVEYDFTASMEDDLDRIAAGTEDRNAWLKGFYFGTDNHPGLRSIVDNLGEIDARAINSIVITDQITLRIGKYGPYLEVPDPAGAVAEDGSVTPRRINLPEGMAPDELTAEKAQALVDAPPVVDRVVGVNPENGKHILAKDGRFGPYVTEVEPEAEESPAKKSKTAPKPRTASIFKSMDLATIDLDTALLLLNLPRVVGTDPESSAEITAQNGRYGAYLKKGTDTRSLPSEDAILTIDLAGAVELFAQPKYGARTASSALKEFAADPESGKPIKVKDGRFGPYVTDGVTNATIPKGESVDEITFERAVELLAIKRAKGPVKKRVPAKKAPAKKAPVKKTPVKKAPAATTTAAKKTPAKTATTKTATTKTAAAKTTAAKTTTAKTAAAKATTAKATATKTVAARKTAAEESAE
ncbi:type I DNA topoisomerase [Klugiella xanthotipulae]|uniref:DNA topoisomerase 1 n=1 Tax=Klugiella xanthotipulae TaxID=244735 RepID=A0A543HZ19_9MICO|nr:type I DNA topoisomerase [Klugiella xanthotipulae]TQM63571.1 DNA topoisomerase I [Klugiella xanthotipulae]